MKSVLRVLIFSQITFLLLIQVSAQDHVGDTLAISKSTCSNAFLLSCDGSTTFNENFMNGNLAPEISATSCIVENDTYGLQEFWVKLELEGYWNYYLDGYGVNGGFEVFTGTCDNLQFETCQESSSNNTYFALFSPQHSTYYIRVFGSDFNGANNFQLVLQCFSPQPTCELSIETVEMEPCKDENGFVEVVISGNTTGNMSNSEISGEALTDDGLFYFSGYSVNNTWTVTIELSGTQIEYILVGRGSSAGFCYDNVEFVNLPIETCDDVSESALLGNIIWKVGCLPRYGIVGFYEPSTTTLVESYNVVVQNNGQFTIDDLDTGVYDVLVKIDGCLAKGFSDIEIGSSELNLLSCGSLSRGEISGDNFVDVIDISLINNWFNQTVTEGSNALHLDLNCDGMINIIDVSVVGGSFGMMGDTLPLN